VGAFSSLLALQTLGRRCRHSERGKAYRKEWDESRGVWEDRPRHDDASHGADAFPTFASSNYTPRSTHLHLPRKQDFGWWSDSFLRRERSARGYFLE
jgi:hypothetical protein